MKYLVTKGFGVSKVGVFKKGEVHDLKKDFARKHEDCLEAVDKMEEKAPVEPKAPEVKEEAPKSAPAAPKA